MACGGGAVGCWYWVGGGVVDGSGGACWEAGCGDGVPVGIIGGAPGGPLGCATGGTPGGPVGCAIGGTPGGAWVGAVCGAGGAKGIRTAPACCRGEPQDGQKAAPSGTMALQLGHSILPLLLRGTPLVV